MFLFPFRVFLKLQLLVQFSNCFEERNRPSRILSSGSVLPASKETQLVNHQFILPTIRYTPRKDKTLTTPGLAYIAKTVSKFKLILGLRKIANERYELGFIYIGLRIGMGPRKLTRRR